MRAVSVYDGERLAFRLDYGDKDVGVTKFAVRPDGQDVFTVVNLVAYEPDYIIRRTFNFTASEVDRLVFRSHELRDESEMNESMLPGIEQAQSLIAQECDALKEFLLAKNKAYGNSVFSKARVFKDSTPAQRIQARIEDKLNRLECGTEYPGDDTLLDLTGYIILYRIVKRVEEGG